MQRGRKNGRTRGGCEEEGGADGFKEVELLAGLYRWSEGGGEGEKKDRKHTAWLHFVSKKATAVIERDEPDRSIRMKDGKRRTHDDELCGHEEAQGMEENLEGWPAWGSPETPGAGGEDKGVPCCDGEGADKEVLVCAQMRGQVELVGQLDRRGSH